MKDRIFVAWSGTNAVALKIKEKLEKKNYKCVIGGNSDNSSTFASIGDTVIQQIKSCNQAIIIFQNKADGSVSNNLFFELGYVLSSYGTMKIHCVRKATETVVLPSDFDNSFVAIIEKCETEDEFVDGILEYFFKRQKLSINENKMILINNRYRIHDFIQSHFSDRGSKCSDYELAQYILFYMQAAHMFNDEKKIYKEVKKFRDENHEYFSDELNFSVEVCLSFLVMVTGIQIGENGEVYINKDVYRSFRDENESIYNQIQEDDTGTFDEWCKVFISQHICYCYNLYANNPNLKPEQKMKYYQKTKDWAIKSLEDLKALENATDSVENNDHRGLISLLYAYVYRNLFNCSLALEDGQELEWLEKTKKERASLKTNFQSGSLDTQLYSTFLMEYYLTLTEYLNYADVLGLDEDDVEDYKDEILEYVNESKKQNDKIRYIERIEHLCKKL